MKESKITGTQSKLFFLQGLKRNSLILE